MFNAFDGLANWKTKSGIKPSIITATELIGRNTPRQHELGTKQLVPGLLARGQWKHHETLVSKYPKSDGSSPNTESNYNSPSKTPSRVDCVQKIDKKKSKTILKEFAIMECSNVSPIKTKLKPSKFC